MDQQVIEIDEASKSLKVLGDKTRLSIMCLLREGECCVCEFVDILQMSQPSISQHLRKLRDAGLVNERRNSQWIFYSLNKDHEAFGMIECIMEHIPDQRDKLHQLEKDGRRIRCD